MLEGFSYLGRQIGVTEVVPSLYRLENHERIPIHHNYPRILLSELRYVKYCWQTVGCFGFNSS